MSGPGSDIFSLKSFKIFAESNFSCTFAIPKGKFTDNWCGSSVGLEYRPVTPGVASSSLVRTAETEFSHLARLRFLFCDRPPPSAIPPNSRTWTPTRNHPYPQPENREASPPPLQGPRWHIEMLRATFLAGKASGCTSQRRQGRMRMLCEFRVDVSCSAQSGYSARQEQKATIRQIDHSFCQVYLSF